MTSVERISRPYVGLFQGRQCSSVNRDREREREGQHSRMGITKALYRREKTSLFPRQAFLFRKPTILLDLFTTVCVWVFQDRLEPVLSFCFLPLQPPRPHPLNSQTVHPKFWHRLSKRRLGRACSSIEDWNPSNYNN